MMLKSSFAAILVMAASTALAQVQIIESKPIGGKPPSQARTPAPVDTGAQAELYYQLQILQQEVQELRGLVEQQSFELRQLKQQRMDDYLDLDRRLSQLSSGAAASTRGNVNVDANSSLPSSDANVSSAGGDTSGNDLPSAAQADELAAYRTAIDLVLKQRDFDGGASALQKYLQDFPSGHYAANALYWLGQIYLQKNEPEQSQAWFSRMIQQFPDHQKTPEAKFKLGKLYHSLGDVAQARELLEEVAASNSPAAGLAKDFLQQNF